MAAEPPFEKAFHSILGDNSGSRWNGHHQKEIISTAEGECMSLPLIDFSRLYSHEYSEQEKCIDDIVEAASKWGFFQIVNHGVPEEILKMMYYEGKQLFELPFSEKVRENFLNLPANSYRWGNPRANSPVQFSWSEALHVSLSDVSSLSGRDSLRSTIEVYAEKLGKLAIMLCKILGQRVKVKRNYFEESCKLGSSFLRVNRYFPSASSFEVFGLIPHTDTDFLTILYQDQVGGLELNRDGRWIDVNPRREALIINIGDLFQALSNGVYKSIEHRVVPPREAERVSIAFFLCPNDDTQIESFGQPKIYQKFSFGEYKEQIHRDVAATGNKIGLSRFLISRNNL